MLLTLPEMVTMLHGLIMSHHPPLGQHIRPCKTQMGQGKFPGRPSAGLVSGFGMRGNFPSGIRPSDNLIYSRILEMVVLCTFSVVM